MVLRSTGLYLENYVVIIILSTFFIAFSTKLFLRSPASAGSARKKLVPVRQQAGPDPATNNCHKTRFIVKFFTYFSPTSQKKNLWPAQRQFFTTYSQAHHSDESPGNIDLKAIASLKTIASLLTVSLREMSDFRPKPLRIEQDFKCQANIDYSIFSCIPLHSAVNIASHF